MGRVRPSPRRRRNITMGRDRLTIFGPGLAHSFSVLSSAQLSGPAQPSYLILYNIYYIIILFKKTKKIQIFFKKSFKKIVIFSNMFLPIFHNIKLYIYTVKYKFGMKIAGFLRNISKKNQNIFKKISKNFQINFPFQKQKKNILFSCIRPNLKNFPSIFSLKDCIFIMF